jgi:dienelactone hydrolase
MSWLPVCATAQVTMRKIDEGQVKGEYYVPAQVPAPAIFVLHSAFGAVDTGDRAMAKLLAEQGFVAFAIVYPVRSSPKTWAPAYLDWMKKQREPGSLPFGAVGFSAGGARVFTFALDPRVKAVVSYYGTYDYKTSPLANLRANSAGGPILMVDQIRAAALLLHGDRDAEVPLEQVERMKQALQAKGLPVDVAIYRGAYHNFDRGPETGAGDRTQNGTLIAYDSAAAKDAVQRTVQWFKTYLK